MLGVGMFGDGAIFVVSLVALLYSADRLIDCVVDLARRFDVSTMVIGLTVVAIGTSLPEAMASAVAALDGRPQIAVANVLGSNICNVGLILGLPALMYVISCRDSVLLREGVLMLSTTAAMWVVLGGVGGMNRTMGVCFLLAFLGFVAFAVRGGGGFDGGSEEEDKAPETSIYQTCLILVISFVVLLASSNGLVYGTKALALALGVPDKVVSITLLAFGTSVPELSVSFVAAKRGHGDILVGNILGSNVSNILLVLGLTAVINPFTTTQVLDGAELPIVALFAVLMIYFLSQKSGINRPKGMAFLLMYILFILGTGFNFL